MCLLSLFLSPRHLVLTTAGDKILDNSGFWSNPAQHLYVLTLILTSVNLLFFTPETLSSLILLEACSSPYDFCHEYCIPFLLQAVPSSKRQHIWVVKSKYIGQTQFLRILYSVKQINTHFHGLLYNTAKSGYELTSIPATLVHVGFFLS